MPYETFGDLFRRCTNGKEPFPYQERLADSAHLPALLEAPTGAGKTLAIFLAWLWRRRFHPDPIIRAQTPRRLVYCLPMRVLVEQTVTVARLSLERVGLLTADVDGKAIRLVTLMGGEDGGDWDIDPTADAVLVGTQDMLLSRALNRGYGMSRFRWPVHFGYLNSDCLWVIDEVQLMGNGLATTVQLDGFRQIVGVAAPCPSIWMSATIHADWLQTVDAAIGVNPEVHRIDEHDRSNPRLAKRLRAVKVLTHLALAAGKSQPYDPASLAAAVAAYHLPEGLTLIIVNTVRRAQGLAEHLHRHFSKSADPPEIVLLHSRFRPAERAELVRRLDAPRTQSGRIVVSTQVVEAGIDLSARVLVTELAPWASLIQRFGRCNRFGEFDQAAVFWIDLDSAKHAAPYEPADLDLSRDRLVELAGESVAPDALPPPTRGPEATHVIRRRDLFDLFDTTPDLVGNDVDVGRFVRGTEELDVQVFWRRWHNEESMSPPDNLPAPTRSELCPVPVSEMRAFLRDHPRRASAWCWDHVDGTWRRIDLTALRPGLTLLLAASSGGYAPAEGWVGPKVEATEPVEASGAGMIEGIDDDAHSRGNWESIAHHSQRVVARLDEIVAGLLPLVLSPGLTSALRLAARWHDRGKAHPVFQETLLRSEIDLDLRAGRASTFWAKSPRLAGRHRRRHFRHELASALAVLQADLGNETDELRDLVAYLVAAHHGKVRLGIRSFPDEQVTSPHQRVALGIIDGDLLPLTDLGDGQMAPALALDLDVMELGSQRGAGGSWVERMTAWRDRLGPFRLAYLEALVVSADVQASREAGDGRE